ncbi:MAG: Uma2 family endonuclease [Caldilineaceae bacterium]|nr:Uma2 family endonuclease [Caldilineaceae bacterium]
MTSKPTDSIVVDRTDFSKKQNGLPTTVTPVSEAGRAVSEEEYWANYYEFSDIHYEWNNGILEEKPVGDYAQFRLYFWFINLLHDFLHVNPIARMIGLEMAFRMQIGPDDVKIRKPDLGVVLNTNPVPLGDKDRSYRGVFDLCIESISDSTPGETARDTVTKKQEYAAGGVQEYYILDERGRVTEFYELSASGVYVPIRPENGVIRSTILPGFQFRYADIYRLPQPPDLLDDEIYHGFASPFIRAERQRTEQERQRTEQERERAEQERERAERYAAMLADLGVSVDDES